LAGEVLAGILVDGASLDAKSTDELIEQFKRNLKMQLDMAPLPAGNLTAEAILITMCNFKACDRAKPEEQYRSSVWSTVFNSALAFHSAAHFVRGVPEYSMSNILSGFGINQTAHVDYAYEVSVDLPGNYRCSAPIFLMEASGFSRQDKAGGMQHMPKDFTRLAILMSICYRYWAGILPSYSDDLKIYGCFVNQTEFQPCVVYGAKDATGNLSCIFESGDFLSFTVENIDEYLNSTTNSSSATADWITNQFPGIFCSNSSNSSSNPQVDDTAGKQVEKEDLQDECALDSLGSRDAGNLADFQGVSSSAVLRKWVSLLIDFVDDIFDTATKISAAADSAPPGTPKLSKPSHFPLDSLTSRDSHAQSSPSQINKYDTPSKSGATQTGMADSFAKHRNLCLSHEDLRHFMLHPRSTLICRYRKVGKDGKWTAVAGTLVLKQASTPKEAQLLQDLRLSSRIVELFDFHFDHAGQYLFMLQEQLIDMRTIVCEMKRDYWSLVPRLYQFLLDGLQALVQLHSRGILHGDVSTGNVMYSQRDDCFKLIDLGQSSFISRDDGHGAVCRGTDGFIAPEVKAATENSATSRCSPKTDVYALGRSFFRCFDGAIHEAMISYGMNWPEPLRHLWNFVVNDLTSPDPGSRPVALTGFNTVLSMWQQHRYQFAVKLHHYNDYSVVSIDEAPMIVDAFQSSAAGDALFVEEEHGSRIEAGKPFNANSEDCGVQRKFEMELN
jgi:hypothetical protein